MTQYRLNIIPYHVFVSYPKNKEFFITDWLVITTMKRINRVSANVPIQLFTMIVMVVANTTIVDCDLFSCHGRRSGKILSLAGSFDITGQELKGSGSLNAAHLALHHIYYNSTLLRGYCLNMTWGDTKVSR